MKKKWNPKYKGYARADKAKIGTVPDFKENQRFTEIYDELKDICKFIDKDKKSELTQSLKNYVLIRLVNVAESQLQTITTDLIDGFKIHPADILRKNEITISLYELDLFRQKDTTNGKIVTQAFQFANIRKIGEIFSSINKLKFFPWLQDLFNYNIEEEFENILLTRNDIVHNLHDVEWSTSELTKKIEHVQRFMNIFYIVSWLNIDTEPKHKKVLESICKDKLSKTLDEFRKIAKKHEF